MWTRRRECAEESVEEVLAFSRERIRSGELSLHYYVIANRASLTIISRLVGRVLFPLARWAHKKMVANLCATLE
jgi:hypothetical protein